MSGVPEPYRFKHQHVGPNQTSLLLTGSTVGDYLHRIVVTVTSGSNGAVSISDDSHTHLIVPDGVGKGVYSVELNMVAQLSGWKVTTGSAVEVLAVGTFGS